MTGPAFPTQAQMRAAQRAVQSFESSPAYRDARRFVTQVPMVADSIRLAQQAALNSGLTQVSLPLKSIHETTMAAAISVSRASMIADELVRKHEHQFAAIAAPLAEQGRQLQQQMLETMLTVLDDRQRAGLYFAGIVAPPAYLRVTAGAEFHEGVSRVANVPRYDDVSMRSCTQRRNTSDDPPGHNCASSPRVVRGPTAHVLMFSPLQHVGSAMLAA